MQFDRALVARFGEIGQQQLRAEIAAVLDQRENMEGLDKRVVQIDGRQSCENGAAERQSDCRDFPVAGKVDHAGFEIAGNRNEFAQHLQGGGPGGNENIVAADARSRLVFQFHGAGGVQSRIV